MEDKLIMVEDGKGTYTVGFANATVGTGTVAKEVNKVRAEQLCLRWNSHATLKAKGELLEEIHRTIAIGNQKRKTLCRPFLEIISGDEAEDFLSKAKALD